MTANRQKSRRTRRAYCIIYSHLKFRLVAVLTGSVISCPIVLQEVKLCFEVVYRIIHNIKTYTLKKLPVSRIDLREAAIFRTVFVMHDSEWIKIRLTGNNRCGKRRVNIVAESESTYLLRPAKGVRDKGKKKK